MGPSPLMGFLPAPRTAARLVFAMWAAMVLVGGASLMASHLAALPTPAAADPRVAAEVSRDPASRGRWTLVHVLARSCGCSRDVLAHIARRGPMEATHERILWVTSDRRPPPAADAFSVDILSAADLTSRLGVIGAPTLIIADPAGRVRYVGGYTRQKQSPIVADVDLATRLRRGEAVAQLPVLGCALDQNTARRLDPLGLR